MCDLLIQKTVPAEECERFANALTGRECRCDPSKLYTISVKAHGVAEQHQGEPVALPARKGTHLRYDTLMPTFSKGWNACLDEITKLGPLYPAPADPGEVERLKSIERSYGLREALLEQVKGERDRMIVRTMELADQLAERDALLRDLLMEDISPRLAGCIEVALSASADPSALALTEQIPDYKFDDLTGKGPEINVSNCKFFGGNEDGSAAFTYEKRGDGLFDLKAINLNGWVCFGPMHSGPYLGLPTSAQAEMTDEQIIEAMRSYLNDADGGYVVDTAPDDVVKAGRALLACAGRSAQVEIDERAAFEQNRLDEILAQSSEQHQGEPVAWLVKCKQSGLVEQAEPNEKASNPEHWTDAFPVYDSPKSARSQFDYDRGFAAGTAECETLRAQLTERDALLEDLKGKTILSWADKHRIGAALERKL